MYLYNGYSKPGGKLQVLFSDWYITSEIAIIYLLNLSSK